MLAHLWTYAPIVTQYGVWGVAVVAALAVAWFFPPWRLQALITAACIVVGLICLHYGDGIGAKRIQAQWNNSLAAEAVQGEEARSDAERTVRAEPPDVVRRDPRNRDNWKK